MSQRVVLHIGSPKSGTTYIQSNLWANRARLLDRGVLLPGRRADHYSLAAFTRGEPKTRGVRDRVLRQVRDWHGVAMITCEWFTMTSRENVALLVEDLAPAEVEVVFTTRPFTSSAPAAWQQTLRNGLASALGEFINSMPTREDRWGWSTLDPAEVLPRWDEAVTPGRVHVVTMPPPGSARTLLWDRYMQACRLPADDFDMEGAVPNESISAESARLLQLIGRELRAAVDADASGLQVQRRWLRQYFSQGLLQPHRGHAILVSPPQVAQLQERARATVKFLESADYDIVGDLNELLAHHPKPNALAVEDVETEALLELTTAIIPPMLGALRAERVRAVRAERLAAGQADDPADKPSVPPAPPPERPFSPRQRLLTLIRHAPGGTRAIAAVRRRRARRRT